MSSWDQGAGGTVVLVFTPEALGTHSATLERDWTGGVHEFGA